MSFLTGLGEIADLLGFLNLGQNISQSKQLKMLKVVLQNQIDIITKINDLDKKMEDKKDNE